MLRLFQYINIKNQKVLFVKKDAKNAIEEMIITDVTGDLNQYGIVTSVPSSNSNGGTYKVDVTGLEITVSNSKTFSVTRWQPCKITYSGNAVDSISPLKKYSSAVKNLTETECTSGTNEYLISDKAVAYVRKADYTYMMISLKDLEKLNSALKMQ